MKTQLHEGEKRRGEGRRGECWVLSWVGFEGKEEGLAVRLEAEGFPYGCQAPSFHSGEE